MVFLLLASRLKGLRNTLLIPLMLIYNLKLEEIMIEEEIPLTLKNLFFFIVNKMIRVRPSIPL